jgi:hypothetical protein
MSHMSQRVPAGDHLRKLRESLGLSLRDIEAASLKISLVHGSQKFAIPFSRLRHIETSTSVPSIHRLYSLSVIYHVELASLMEWYGVDLKTACKDLRFGEAPVTHRIELSAGSEGTSNLYGAQVPPEATGTVDQSWLHADDEILRHHFIKAGSNALFYACVGTKDYTMYPLLMPGTLLRIDSSQCTLKQGVWRSEYERPIYFVETRNGYKVGWCSRKGTQLTLHPHPLSGIPATTYTVPREAEIIGVVVTISMHLKSTVTERTQIFSSRPEQGVERAAAQI